MNHYVQKVCKLHARFKNKNVTNWTWRRGPSSDEIDKIDLVAFKIDEIKRAVLILYLE